MAHLLINNAAENNHATSNSYLDELVRLHLRSYSFEAASLSKNHFNSPSGETIWTGNTSEFWLFPNAVCTTLALPAPHTTRAICEDELMTGNVNVILPGGGFGESVMWVTHFWFSLRSGWPGNREATCPSGPMPTSMRSNFGNPLTEDLFITPVWTKCLRQVS